ncbi:uncharacterized protein [Dermacentor albipictus]|uniref:uncharacterized protein isoform X2 n=1 Tax=Dermacentor albipictus TaxID=60249 RepID=UPI0038FBF9DF
MQPSNPFLFILQIGFLLFPTGLTPACYELQASSRAAFIGDKYLLMHPVSLDESYRPFHDGAGVTSTDKLGSPMTTAWSDPIKQDAYGTAGSGHGSIAKMQPSNPFLVILQVKLLLICFVAKAWALRHHSAGYQGPGYGGYGGDGGYGGYGGYNAATAGAPYQGYGASSFPPQPYSFGYDTRTSSATGSSVASRATPTT